jgi:hypothetical protein
MHASVTYLFSLPIFYMRIRRPLANVNVGQASSLTAIGFGGLQTRPTGIYARGLLKMDGCSLGYHRSLDKPGFLRDADGSIARLDAELGINGAQVSIHCATAEDQPLGDLRIGEALREQAQHL